MPFVLRCIKWQSIHHPDGVEQTRLKKALTMPPWLRTSSVVQQGGAMQALEAILTRVTVPPVKMGEPGPDDAALGRMLEAAAAAPDHGKLRPWRFLVVRGEGRARLGELFAEALLRERPATSAAEIEKQRTAPKRAPLIIVAIARIDPDHPKIPAWEQQASAACAVHNLLLAAHAMGFAGKWATGGNAASPIVRDGLGLAATEGITGLLYIGTAVEAQPTPPRPSPDMIAQPWP
jgi:nitroreductase